MGIFVRLWRFNSPIYGTIIYEIWVDEMSYIKPNSALPRILCQIIFAWKTGQNGGLMDWKMGKLLRNERE